MEPALDYKSITKTLRHKDNEGLWLCCLIFAPPETNIGKAIMARAEDWHHHSGDLIDFFCAGYIDSPNFDTDKLVAQIPEGNHVREFYYSSKAFNSIRQQIQRRPKCKWTYSGEADLILVNAVRYGKGDPVNNIKKVRLAFDYGYLVMDVHRVVKDEVYPTANMLFADICNAAEKANEKGESLSVMDYSNRGFFRQIFKSTVEEFVNTLGLKSALASRHYLVTGESMK